MGVILRQLTKADGSEQVIISERGDGTFTYQIRWRDGVQWGALGPAVGVYDTALTAETEAMQGVAWLAENRQ